MELMIDFTCPRCHQTAPQKLREMTPGQSRDCPSCRVPLKLTGRSLQNLSRDLENYCRA